MAPESAESDAQSHTDAQRIEEQERFWGARDALRKSIQAARARNKRNMDTTERTPLLNTEGDSSACPSRDGSNGVSETATLWEGSNDYEGLTWWRTPSVSLYPSPS